LPPGMAASQAECLRHQWLRYGAALVAEMAEMRVKVSGAGREQYGAWREGTHDDLVFAVALGGSGDLSGWGERLVEWWEGAGGSGLIGGNGQDKNASRNAGIAAWKGCATDADMVHRGVLKVAP
jgi:hypothetical protein